MILRWIAINGSFLVLYFIILPCCSDCFEFVSLAFDQNVYANRSGEALFRWKYTLGNAQTTSLKIECFYYYNNYKSTHVIVRKSGHDARVVFVSNTPNRVDVKAYNELLSNERVDHSVVGFTIMQSDRFTKVNYGCRGIYLDRIRQQLFTKTSGMKTLVIVDPPKFIKCLESLDTKPAESTKLKISCSANGNPLPTVVCKLITDSGSVYGSVPPEKEVIARNISNQVFPSIIPTVKKVVCVADGGPHTGSVNKMVSITVQYRPFAPRVVEFLPDDSKTSLLFRWLQIPKNETGGSPLTGYTIIYYPTGSGEMANVKTLSLSQLQLSNGFYQYMLADLDATREYSIEVYGVNRLFDGRRHPPIKQKPSHNAKESSSKAEKIGIIFGGIIGGILLIVIFVVLCVCAMHHNKKRKSMPTSHIEDVIDYPFEVNETDNADEKKSFNGTHKDYPDLVTDATFNQLDDVHMSKSYV